ARQQLDQVVLRLPPTRLAELNVGQIGEVARVDRAALEVWRAADDDPALRAEILRLLEELVLEEEVAALALGEPQAHLHDALVLHRLVGRAEGDRHAREAADVAGEHEVGVALGDDAQRPLPAELVLDGPVQADLQAGLARVVGEQRDADGPGARGDGRARAGEVVAAGGEHEEGEEGGAPHTIKLSMRPGTKTTLRTGRPPTWISICGSASAAATTWASPASAGTVMRPRSLPFTCTGSSIRSRASAPGSAAGQRSASSARAWPAASHSSLAMCGTKGASRRSVASTASRSTAGLARSLASPSAFTSSMTAATAVLKWSRSTTSPVTRRMVSWVRRWSSRSSAPSWPGSRVPGGARRGASACTRRQRRWRKRCIPSTPWSLHSRSFSGGAWKRQNRRAVSAP